MAGAGAGGALLLDPGPASRIVKRAGPAWQGQGSPSPFPCQLPPDPSLVGRTFFAQAMLIDPTNAFGVKLGLTEALALTIGS